MNNVLIFIFSSVLMAQVSFTGNTETRIGESKNGFYYNETLVNTHLNYGRFINWFQFEFSDPPELGNSLNGLRKLRLEYRRDGFEIKLGDIYEIWGRGLILNSSDDQSIDRDTGIRGLSISYNKDPLNVHFITGKSDIQLSTPTNASVRKHDYIALHNLFGLNADYSLGNHTIGSSFIQSKEAHAINLLVSTPDTVNIKTQLMSVKYSYNHAVFDLYSEYVKNQSYELDETSNLYSSHVEGRGFYGNVNLYLNFLSLNFEYINYRFGALEPDNRGNFVDYFGMYQPFQSPPIAMNINTNVLMNRVLHQTNFNNEVGYKIELMGMINDRIDFHGIYSASSQSHSWVMDENFQWTKEGEAAFLPYSEKSTTPFREIFGELSIFMLDNRLHMEAGYSDSYDVTKLDYYTKTDTSSDLYYTIQKSITLPLHIAYTFDSGLSLDAKVETQFLTQGYNRVATLNGSVVIDTFVTSFKYDENGNGIYDEDEFMDYATNHYISLSVSKSPLWSIAFSVDKTDFAEVFVGSEEFENPLEKLLGIDQTRNWVNVEFVYNISPAIRLSLLYGSLKGGLICANGICRIIEPFNDGFKFGLTAVF